MSNHRPLLFAAAETVAALADARAVALLVGSYDGSGNFGDIAQLDANLELLETFGDELLVLPLLELVRARDHRELAGRRLSRPLRNPLFMGPGEPAPEDRLIPVATPERLDFAAVLLYGGGYMNRLWGRRKLDMLATVDRLAENARRVRRVSTGLQVERGWLAGLAGGDRERIASFELLGSRDPISLQALAEFSPAAAFESGDDAVGVLARAHPGPPTEDDRKLRVNVHLAEHEFVSEAPGPILDFYVEFLAALEREAGRAVSAQPLIAYLDFHCDERPGLERLNAACRAAGIEVEEPILLAPSTIEEAALEVARGSLTLTCSYHVALMSLTYAVPAVGVHENDYYGHKVAGLRESFGLPEALAVDSSLDATEAAARVAAAVLDEERGAALRARLRERARDQEERRRAVAAKVRERLTAAPRAAPGRRSAARRRARRASA